MLGDERPQPGEPEHLALEVVSLYQPIAVEKNAIALSQRGLSLLVARPSHKAQGHPSGPQFLCHATMAQVRQIMACVGIAQASVMWVEDGVEAGYEHVGRYAS